MQIPEVPKVNIILAPALYLVLLLFSCSAPEKISAPAEEGFSQEHVSGSFSLLLQTSSMETTAAGEIKLVLEAKSPENTTVEFQEFGVSMGDFTLRGKQFSTPRLTGSGNTARILYRATYSLEPYLPGTYTIPAMTVIFRYAENDREAELIRTEAMEIPVRSLLDPDAETTDIRDISQPLSLGPDKVFQLTLLGLALLGTTLAAGIYLFWQKKKKERIVAPVALPPDQIALRELEKLEHDNLLARGEIQFFHERLSGILRCYIENRFGLKAPERTTEEFLNELSRAPSSPSRLLGNHKSVLANFLTQCDLVKFARYEPSMAASEKRLDICRKFIEKTREKS